MIYILLVGLIIQLVYCYYVFKKDLFSPSAIICEVFILSTLACIYNTAGTDYDIQPITAGVILGGNTVFIAVSSIIHFIFSEKHKTRAAIKGKEDLKYIEIRRGILVVTTLLYLIFSVVFIVMNISAMRNISQADDFSASMGAYRGELLEEGSNLPGPITRINMILGTGVFVIVYIFINNLLVDKKRKSNYLLLFCVILYLFSSVFTAQRTTILIVFLFTLFVTYSLLNRKYQFTERINGKYMRRGILVVTIFLLLFGATRGLFGRAGEVAPIESVTNYMGNSIEFLDAYIRHPLESKQFGEETFWKSRDLLSKYNLVDPPTKSSFLEFRQAVQGNQGNVYTGYRGYIHDFGYIAIIPFQVFLALFFGIWYERINHRRLKSNIDLSFILFAWFIAFGLFRFSIANTCFTYMAYLFLTTRWLMFLLWKWFFGLKISINNNTSNRVSAKTYIRNHSSN